MNSEEWKPIPDYPKYEASSEGRIRGPKGLHKLTIMSRAGRQANAKLNWELVRIIRARFEKGESQAEIARSLNIGQSQISNVVRGKSWKHSNDPMCSKEAI